MKKHKKNLTDSKENFTLLWNCLIGSDTHRPQVDNRKAWKRPLTRGCET